MNLKAYLGGGGLGGGGGGLGGGGLGGGGLVNKNRES